MGSTGALAAMRHAERAVGIHPYLGCGKRSVLVRADEQKLPVVFFAVVLDEFAHPLLWRLGGVLLAVGQGDYDDVRRTYACWQLLDPPFGFGDRGRDGVVECGLATRFVRRLVELRRTVE